mmetsp:Transcript_1294/g.2663  ORF Transcript_1294/g.2663 Transcript_1294/m.2663 type:complete len:251 (-) Transcript_1294:574-1326(-)
MCFVPPLKKARSAEHFSDDTTYAPHVDFGAVIDHTQEQFGRSVPQGNNLVCQSLHFRVPASGKTPIRNLEFTFAVDQEIGCFEIAMDDLVFVHVVGSCEELLRPRFDMVLRQSDFGGFQYAGQIVFQILKDHKDVFGEGSIRSLLLGANNFLEQDHVGVFEPLQEFDLAKCCDGETVFLLLRIDALEGDDFVRSSVARHEDASIRSLAYLEFLLIGIDVSHDDGSSNGNGLSSIHAGLLRGRSDIVVDAV